MFKVLPGLSKKPSETTQLDLLINKFFDDIANLPNFHELQLFNERDVICKRFKETVITEQHKVHKKMEDIHSQLIRGEYDKIIFSENPTISDEFRVVMIKYSRDLVQILFTKCQSENTLHFWLKEQQIPLPQDTLALAVNLGANIVVLHYLNEERFFDGLSKEDKKELVDKASRFPGPGLDYLIQMFSEQENKPHL